MISAFCALSLTLYAPFRCAVHFNAHRTVQTDKKSVRYCGWTGGGHDSIELDGNPADLKWVAAYVKDGAIVAVSSCQRDPAVSQAAELIRLGKMPSVEQLKEAKFDFGQFLGEKAVK